MPKVRNREKKNKKKTVYYTGLELVTFWKNRVQFAKLFFRVFFGLKKHFRLKIGHFLRGAISEISKIPKKSRFFKNFLAVMHHFPLEFAKKLRRVRSEYVTFFGFFP